MKPLRRDVARIASEQFIAAESRQRHRDALAGGFRDEIALNERPRWLVVMPDHARQSAPRFIACEAALFVMRVELVGDQSRITRFAVAGLEFNRTGFDLAAGARHHRYDQARIDAA